MLYTFCYIDGLVAVLSTFNPVAQGLAFVMSI